MHLSEMKRDKRPAFYFRPISSKSTLAKEKARRNTKSEEEERRRRKKMAPTLLVFILATLESFWP